MNITLFCLIGLPVMLGSLGVVTWASLRGKKLISEIHNLDVRVTTILTQPEDPKEPR